MSDKRIKAIAKDAAVQITAAISTQTVERARTIHKTVKTSTAALGRALTICSIMGSQLKTDNGSITVQFKGNGPLGSLICVSDSNGNVRGYVQNPACDVNGKIDVGAGIGKGYLMVIKDIGLKEPVTGTTVLVNGEIAEDMTKYFAESEQIPSACALGVSIGKDQSIINAGGYLVQLMPSHTEEDISKLEQNIKNAGSITKMLSEGLELVDIVKKILDGFEVEILEEAEFEYKCNCSKEKVARALISIGKKDLEELYEKQEKVEITCQFCDNAYYFKKDDIRKLF